MKNKHLTPLNFYQYLSELIGTFFLVFLGCGSVILSELNSGFSTFLIPLVFGATVSIMIYSLGHISGAHFNPAVTFGFLLIKKLKIKKALFYIVFQFIGAVLASLLHLYLFDNHHSFGVTKSILTLDKMIVWETLMSFLLMFVIVSVATDSRAVGEFAGLAIGSTVTLCAIVGGPLTGASMNPARSLGPAIVSGDLSQIMIYLIFPFLGCGLGAIIYNFIKCYNQNSNSSDQGCC